ncbi:hypothetical protein Tco_0322142 [Tanacetum coccineum]
MLTMASRGKKKSTPLLILSIRLTKLIIHHLKTKHNIYPRTGSPLHYSYEDNILGTLGYVGKDGREVFEPPVTTHQSSAWIISDTRDKPSGSSVHHLSPPDDQKLNDDSVLTNEEHSSGDNGLGIVPKDIESEDSYVYNLDEPALLVASLSDANEDECFDPGGNIDEIDSFLDIDVSTNLEDDYYDPEGDIIYLESLLIKYTTHNLPPEVFLDIDLRSLKDEPDNDNLKNMVKVFNPGIWEKKHSPTYVRLSFEDRHYLSLTYVIRIFLPYFTYPVHGCLPSSLLLK